MVVDLKDAKRRQEILATATEFYAESMIKSGRATELHRRKQNITYKGIYTKKSLHQPQTLVQANQID